MTTNLKVDNAIRSQAENSVQPFLDLQCSTWKHITADKYGNICNCVFNYYTEKPVCAKCAQIYSAVPL